jgi:hydrogenase 3 maturation protease
MQHTGPFSEILRHRLEGKPALAIVGIGEELIPPDRPGMYVARELEKEDLPGVRVFCAGTVPESITGPLRRYRPGHVLLIDAADTGARPGTFAVIGPDRIPATLLSTHVLPLPVVMDFIRRDLGVDVTLLGIQPDLARSENGMSANDKAFLDNNLRLLAQVIRDRCSPASHNP